MISGWQQVRIILTGLLVVCTASPVANHFACAGQAGLPAAAATPLSKSNPTQAQDFRLNGRRWPIVDEHGLAVKPMSIASDGQDLFLLGPGNVWKVMGGLRLLLSSQKLVASDILHAGDKIMGIPTQEFNNFVYSRARGALVVLDKSGDLWEYSIASGSWRVTRSNRPIKNLPDPDFIDLCSADDGVLLLDPETNQIWKVSSGSKLSPLLKAGLPWRIKPGEANVSDGLCLSCDGDIYVLKRSGEVARFSVTKSGAFQVPFRFKHPKNMRPSRLITAPSMPLYIVERENNRVLVVNKNTGQVQQFLFDGANLHGLLPQSDGFYIVSGDSLLHKTWAQHAPWEAAACPLPHDSRLDGLILPLSSVRLPRHPGVWPGARRLYRYGVHEGVDFFNDSSCYTPVVMGTPVRAADSGRIIRADAKFKDMTATKIARVLNECLSEHRTSPGNEDLFRGCQVWIDHGNGLITRYAHLSKIKEGLVPGSYVSRGEVIAFVGVSGTGESLPGRSKHPHLHFEIQLDGKYLGWGLTPAETIGAFEDIFGTSCDKGDS